MSPVSLVFHTIVTCFFFLCYGIGWPLFSYFHKQFTVLINYLCALDPTLRILEHMIQIRCLCFSKRASHTAFFVSSYATQTKADINFYYLIETNIWIKKFNSCLDYFLGKFNWFGDSCSGGSLMLSHWPQRSLKLYPNIYILLASFLSKTVYINWKVGRLMSWKWIYSGDPHTS